ncbi:tape measure protein [Lachnospiraceae bacterium 62-35]
MGDGKNDKKENKKNSMTDDKIDIKKELGNIKEFLKPFRQMAKWGESVSKSLIEFSDAAAQTHTRLRMLTESEEEFRQLQERIFQSAVKTRSVYDDTADTIAMMMRNAGNAFRSNDELVTFMEAVNMQFAVEGAGAKQAEDAMQGLTQGMMSGTFKAGELDTILAAAPGIGSNIEKYMGWKPGSLKKYAEEGEVTADTVKKAMLSSHQEISRSFNEMPKTFQQAANQIRTYAFQEFEEVGEKINDFLNSDAGNQVISGIISGLQVLSEVASVTVDLLVQGAEWAVENWDYVYPVLFGIAAAMAAISIASAAAAFSLSPVAAAIIAIGAWVAGLIFTLKQAGVSWATMGAIAGGVLGGLYSYIHMVVAHWWNLFAVFSEFLANVFRDPVIAIENLFHGLIDWIIRTVESAASMIDALLGSNISSQMSAWREKWDNEVRENEIKIKRMDPNKFQEDIVKGSTAGRVIGNIMDNQNFNLDRTVKGFGSESNFMGNITTNLITDIAKGAGAGNSNGNNPGALNFDWNTFKEAAGDTVSFSGLRGQRPGNIGRVGNVEKVGRVEEDIKLSDEDVKLYRDLAEQRYMNNIELQTLAPQISVSIPESAAKNLTAKDIADKLKVLLIEQASSHTAVSHG